MVEQHEVLPTMLPTSRLQGMSILCCYKGTQNWIRVGLEASWYTLLILGWLFRWLFQQIGLEMSRVENVKGWKRVGLFCWVWVCVFQWFCQTLGWKWVGLERSWVVLLGLGLCFCQWFCQTLGWKWVGLERSWFVRLGLGLCFCQRFCHALGWKMSLVGNELGCLVGSGFVGFSMVLPNLGLEMSLGWKRVGLFWWVWVCVSPNLGLEMSWVGNELGCFGGSGFVFLSMVLSHFGLENEFGWKRVGLLVWVWVFVVWVGIELGWQRVGLFCWVCVCVFVNAFVTLWVEKWVWLETARVVLLVWVCLMIINLNNKNTSGGWEKPR